MMTTQNQSMTPETNPIRHALAGVDAASLAHCYITEMHHIFGALVALTEGNKTANGLARVGDALAECRKEGFLNITHELQEALDALKGGAQ